MSGPGSPDGSNGVSGPEGVNASGEATTGAAGDGPSPDEAPQATTALPQQSQQQWGQQAWSAQPQEQYQPYSTAGYPQQTPYQGQQYGAQPYPGYPQYQGQQQYQGQPYSGPQYQQPYPQYQQQPTSGQFPQPGQYPQQPGFPPGVYPQPAENAPKSKLPLRVGLGVVVALVAAVLIGLFASGNGFRVKTTLDRSAAEDGVEQVLTGSYGLTQVADVVCPADQEVAEGATFSCTLTVKGQPQKVTVTFTDDAGTYEVSRPTSR